MLIASGAGVAIGVRHAFEPDHLAAVATLVADRPRPRYAATLGALWGLGHTAALVAIGCVLLVTHAHLPHAVESGFEIAVAAMLIVLGIRSVWLAVSDGDRGPHRIHEHNGTAHVHAGPANHVHVMTKPLAARPLIVGLIHGTAGSGALAAVAMTTMANHASAIAYIGLFGLGSSAGMAAVSAIAAVSMSRATLDGPWLRRIKAGTGAIAVGVGVVWAATTLA
jgi:high-affinity nickel permease